MDSQVTDVVVSTYLDQNFVSVGPHNFVKLLL